jgi:ubiquinone/menaquinone biosynthesis C-methylase UbiE
LGCGNKNKHGFIGVDSFDCEAVDVIADLTYDLPFEDSSIDEIWMDNVIEHMQDIPRLMKELQRICRNGALITIFTPHFASVDSWRDSTHVHHLSYFSMDDFEKEGVRHYMGGGFKVLEKRISFGGILGNIGRLIFKVRPRKYESTWCFIFRPSKLKFIVAVEK